MFFYMPEKCRHFRIKKNYVTNTVLNFKEIICPPRTSNQNEVIRNCFSNYIYISQKYVQNFERTCKNSVFIRVDKFSNSLNF